MVKRPIIVLFFIMKTHFYQGATELPAANSVLGREHRIFEAMVGESSGSQPKACSCLFCPAEWKTPVYSSVHRIGYTAPGSCRALCNESQGERSYAGIISLSEHRTASEL